MSHPLIELRVPEGSVAIHWFEQASYAVKDRAGKIVMLDPYFPHDRPPEKFEAGEVNQHEAGI